MDEATEHAAIHAVHFKEASFIDRDSDKYRSEQGAADNMRWIVKTLIDCFDNKKRPPVKLLYSLRELSHVANLTEAAAKLVIENADDQIFEDHKKKRKEAENALLDSFGLLTRQGKVCYDEQELITKMAILLCPSVNDDLEPVGPAKCSSVGSAAKELAKETGISYKTFQRKWKSFEEMFKLEGQEQA